MSFYKLKKLNSKGGLDTSFDEVILDTISECELYAITNNMENWRITDNLTGDLVLASYHSGSSRPLDKPTFRFCGKNLKVGDELDFSEKFTMQRGKSTKCRFVKHDGALMKQFLKDFSPENSTTYYLSKVKLYSIDKYGVALEVIKLNKVPKKPYIHVVSKKNSGEEVKIRSIAFSRLIIHIKKSENSGLFL